MEYNLSLYTHEGWPNVCKISLRVSPFSSLSLISKFSPFCLSKLLTKESTISVYTYSSYWWRTGNRLQTVPQLMARRLLVGSTQLHHARYLHHEKKHDENDHNVAFSTDRVRWGRLGRVVVRYFRYHGSAIVCDHRIVVSPLGRRWRRRCGRRQDRHFRLRSVVPDTGGAPHLGEGSERFEAVFTDPPGGRLVALVGTEQVERLVFPAWEQPTQDLVRAAEGSRDE